MHGIVPRGSLPFQPVLVAFEGVDDIADDLVLSVFAVEVFSSSLLLRKPVSIRTLGMPVACNTWIPSLRCITPSLWRPALTNSFLDQGGEQGAVGEEFFLVELGADLSFRGAQVESRFGAVRQVSALYIAFLTLVDGISLGTAAVGLPDIGTRADPGVLYRISFINGCPSLSFFPCPPACAR